MKTVLELEDLANKAVKAALNQQWDQAILLNREILEDSPDNVEAANRLARSLQETGSTTEAAAAYQRVLELDPFNSIAQKNLEKLKSGTGQRSQRTSVQELFLEEPGKTRSIAIDSPDQKLLAHYSSGEELRLEQKSGRLAILSPKEELLGFIPDEVGNHLMKLMQLGNQYSAHLMTTSDNPHVFLRETKQSSAAAKYVSFSRGSTSGNGTLSTPRSLRHASTSGIDTNNDDELDDNWDSDDDESSVDEDDLTVSLDQMRDDEDHEYGVKKGEDY